MINSLIVFNLKFGKHIGGTEAYAAQIINFFNNKLNIYIKPAKNVRKYNLQKYMHDYYNIDLKNEIKPASLLQDGLFINVSWNENIHFYKNSIHIIHFSSKLKIKLRKNLYKFFLSIFEKIFYPKAYSFYLCNSEFTKTHFIRNWPKVPHNKIKVLYPPVKLFKHNPTIAKKRQIVIFSRFDPEKKIDILVNAFNRDFINNDIKLVIMGSVSNKLNEEHYQRLKSLATEKIEFIINPERDVIEKVFKESLIFWHAKGYGETEPGLYEHFGITTVETMSAGVIPVVINKGGQCEIVDHGVNGYKWDTLEELSASTNTVLNLSEYNLKSLSDNAVKKSQYYGVDNFNKRFFDIISIWKEILPL
jgi:glycosyltransferase involved in cell wall biosynthesis